jgi:hypothetical protein
MVEGKSLRSKLNSYGDILGSRGSMVTSLAAGLRPPSLSTSLGLADNLE